jgi:hypothetical protein
MSFGYDRFPPSSWVRLPAPPLVHSAFTALVLSEAATPRRALTEFPMDRAKPLCIMDAPLANRLAERHALASTKKQPRNRGASLQLL